MRALPTVLVLLAAACRPAADPPAEGEEVDYATAVVLFVSPDSTAIERMKQQRGEEDFYVIADDAMWYRSLAYELVDSLGIPHAEVGPAAARFMVDGEPELISWEEADMAWFAIVYDGRARPRFTPDVELRQVLLGPVPPDTGGS